MPTRQLMQFSSDKEDPERHGNTSRQGPRRIAGISSTHFLKLVEEHGQTGFWTSDFLTGQVTTSIGLYRLLGVDPTERIGQEEFMAMIHPEDRPLQNDMYVAVRSGNPIDREFRIIRPDNTVRWVRNRAEVVMDGEGRPARAIGLMVDVTSQRSAQKSVEEGWSSYRTLLSAVSSTELRALPGGDRLTLSGWDTLTGQTTSEASGMGWLDVIHPEDREGSRDAWIVSMGSGCEFAVDHRILCVDGEYRWFLARAAPVFDSNGTVREWLGAIIGCSRTHTDASHPTHNVDRLTSAHIRAARALLNWTVERLAFHSGISISSIRRMEGKRESPVRDNVLQVVRESFEENGVSFEMGSYGEVGVRLAARCQRQSD